MQLHIARHLDAIALLALHTGGGADSHSSNNWGRVRATPFTSETAASSVIPMHTVGSSKRPARRTRRPNDDDLFSLLESCMVESQFEKTPFKCLPQRDFDDLVTEGRLMNSLVMCEPSVADKQLLDFILRKAKKTFAITAYIELEGPKLRNAMLFFYSNGFDDRKLPIKEMSPNDTERR